MTGTIGAMPNQPATKVSTFRIPPELKARTLANAQANDTTLTAIIIEAFERFNRKAEAESKKALIVGKDES